MADDKPVQTTKVQHLENEYARQLARQKEPTVSIQHHGLKRRRVRRALRIFAVFAVFALILGVQLVRTNASLHHVNQKVEASEQRLDKAKDTNAKLKLKVKQLNNKDYLGQLIRSKYYYSKSGETIYSLPGDHAKDVTEK
ncbi:FtsB family cell division protein [Levilactobacillus suantsaii]|uniref:Septum formation initiator family protein n=1 Tax=Levilactobacillus suantsaii TaxID=2292255 RepID=A0A4Q0VI36_9LACO|nr:septum formation initiator family protein [Levilactobacillus suantsaii]QMU07032.1 septum formation initiator family protein [Levilactobacillus suantsaii]RXI78357.1 septum formation initiator family protein [Levilactobacillus suantsaii]